MAKKKSKRKAPTRNCEGCGTPYHPRSAKCPKCDRPNPMLRRTATGDTMIAAIDFVEKVGGFKAATAALEKIERIKGLR